MKATKKLNRWIENKGLNHRQAANLFGVTEALMSLILSGKRRAGFDLAGRIQRDTKGEVVFKDWLEGTQ